MIEITQIDDKRIAFYKSLRYTPKIHSENNVFIAEEEKVVVTLLESDIQVISIFGTKEYLDNHNDLISSKNIPETEIYFADIGLMKQIVGYSLHSGFLAIGRQPADVPVKNLTTPIIILNSLANAENVGSIVRNAAAFGYKSIVADETSVSPYLRRAVRVSMGNIFGMDVHHCDSIIETLSQLKDLRIEIIGVEITDESIPISNYKPIDKNYCLIFGSEGKGISSEVLELCSKVIHIPIAKEVPSLNVASSSAVILNRYSNLSS